MNTYSEESSPRLAVVYRQLSELIPDPRNARTHPKRQLDQLRSSIVAFGFTNPILADPGGKIIAGHGRFQARAFLAMLVLVLEDMVVRWFARPNSLAFMAIVGRFACASRLTSGVPPTRLAADCSPVV